MEDLLTNLANLSEEDMTNLVSGISAFLGLVVALLYGKKKKDEKKLNNSKVPLNVRQWEPEALRYSKQFGVPYKIIMAVIWQESLGNEYAIGSASEVGLMQLKQIAVDDVSQNKIVQSVGDWKMNPDENIRIGTAFLKLQNKRCSGNWECTLRSYNQGYAGQKERGSQLASEYYQKVSEKMKFF